MTLEIAFALRAAAKLPALGLPVERPLAYEATPAVVAIVAALAAERIPQIVGRNLELPAAAHVATVMADTLALPITEWIFMV